MSAKGYIREGAVLSESSAGISETQVWDVSSTGAGSAFLWNAREDGSPPKLGDAHPRNSSLIVTDRTFTNIGGTNARVVVTYGVPQIGENEGLGEIVDVRYDGTVTTEEVKKDIKGAPLISGTSAYTVGIPVPRAIVEVDRVESVPPSAIVREYMGRVNRSPLNGYPARTILMHAPRSRRNPVTGNYIVTYVMALQLKSWDKKLEQVLIEFVNYTSEAGAFSPGTPLTKIKSVDVAETDYQVYPDAEFNALALLF